jgi:hypothetical protein
MITPVTLGFLLGGVLIGFTLGWILRRTIDPLAFPAPDVVDMNCENHIVRIEGAIPASPHPAVVFQSLHVQVIDDPNETVLDVPEGATEYGSFPIDHPHSGGTQPPDRVVVWAQWKLFGRTSQLVTCEDDEPAE